MVVLPGKDYLSPDPSPAWVIAGSLSYCWLERGVEERGGSAPSQYFPPLLFRSGYIRRVKERPCLSYILPRKGPFPWQGRGIKGVGCII